MTIKDCEYIIKSYFENNFEDFEHLHNRKLIVNNSNYRIIPDDWFYYNEEVILIEYENTRRPLESISKYWWLLKNTKWLNEKIRIKLFIIGLNDAHKGIRDESIGILGSELKLKFPENIDFYYLPWNNVSESEILKILKQITNMKLKFEIKKTKDCSSLEINNFFELAKKAEQVDLVGLLDRINNSKLLAFCYSNNQLVGISAIKVPNENYKKKIFCKAGIEKEVIDYSFELGYSFTEEKFRGKQICFDLNKELVKKLTDNNIFATTANSGMKKILKMIGFKEIGNTYKGKYNTDEIQIFGFRNE